MVSRRRDGCLIRDTELNDGDGALQGVAVGGVEIVQGLFAFL
jgi:hypothetical protein